jgi:hypothetical protein
LFSTVPNRLRALGELHGPREAVLFARLSAFATAVPVLLRLPVPSWAKLVTRPPRHRPVSETEVERLDRLIALAPRVGQPLVRTGCLTRGVTLYWFLRQAGLDVELRFGLAAPARDETDTDGHCWLALDGEPFLEGVDPRSRFTELYRLPLAETR